MPQHYDPIMPTASVSSEPSTVYSHASGKLDREGGELNWAVY